MRVIKGLILHVLFIAIFLLVVDRIALSLLTDQTLSRPLLQNEAATTLATWPLRADPAMGWALAPPPERAQEIRKGFQLSPAGIGLRWLPGTMDMGPPLVLLVLGDDMAFGPTVPLEDTFGGWIKRSTEERLPERTMAVATSAVPGYDALQMYLQFRRLSTMRPHLALFCFSGGQALSPEAPVTRPSELRNASLKELLYRPALMQALYLGIDRLTQGAEVTGVSWAITPERVREKDVVEFGRALDAIISHSDRVRVPLLMTSLGLPEAYRSDLEARCLNADVEYVDGDEALLEHAEETNAARAGGGATDVAADVSVVAPLDRTNEAHAWWIRQHLRPRMAPLFFSRVYFSPTLLPTRVAYRTVGDALSMAITEGDLFSWRHRVLR